MARSAARYTALACALAAPVLIAVWYGLAHASREQLDRRARADVARAESYLQKGQADRALKTVEGLPEDGPWGARVLAVKGMAHASFNRPEAARPFLERSLALDPKQAMVAKVLAAVYFSANEADRGFTLLERAARIDQGDFRPWFAAGDIILKFRYPPADAVRAFREALRRRPDHDESKIGLIDALLATGVTDETGPMLEKALAEHPSDPRVLCLAARHARLQGRSEEMGRLAEKALELEPDRVEALLLRAQALHLAGRDREALEPAERVVARTPDDPAALHLLASVEGALGLKERSAATSARRLEIQRRSERIQQLSGEIRKRPDDPEPRWRLGQVAAEGGMTTLALNSFRAALALDPNCQPAREGLAALSGRAEPRTP